MEERTQTTEVHRETTEPKNTNSNTAVTTDSKVPGNVLAKRIVHYVGGFIITLLALRFILALFGAAEGNAFVDLVYSLSDVFVWPFYGIFGEPTRGSSEFETSTLVAIAVYALVTVGIAKLFTINSVDPDRA